MFHARQENIWVITKDYKRTASLYHRSKIHFSLGDMPDLKNFLWFDNNSITQTITLDRTRTCILLEGKSSHGHLTTLTFSPTKRSKKKHSIFYDKNDQNTQYVSHLNRSISPSTIMEQKSDKIVKSYIEMVGEVER